MDSCFALSGAHQHGIAVGSMNGENLCLKDTFLPRRVQSTPSSTSSTQYMWELLAGNHIAVLPQHARGRHIRSYPDLCASKFNKTNLKQLAHIRHPTDWPVPHTCAQPYHPGRGSHGQLFCCFGWWMCFLCFKFVWGAGQAEGWCMCAPC